jgi:hypothetical protein
MVTGCTGKHWRWLQQCWKWNCARPLVRVHGSLFRWVAGNLVCERTRSQQIALFFFFFLVFSPIPTAGNHRYHHHHHLHQPSLPPHRPPTNNQQPTTNNHHLPLRTHLPPPTNDPPPSVQDSTRSTRAGRVTTLGSMFSCEAATLLEALFRRVMTVVPVGCRRSWTRR